MSATLLAVSATTRQRLRHGGPPPEPPGRFPWLLWALGLLLMLAAVIYFLR